MALADYGYGTSAGRGKAHSPDILSLTTKPTRKGYAIYASDAANGVWLRIMQSALCAAMVMAGTVLMVAAAALVSPGSIGLWLLPAIGLYLFATGIIWQARLWCRQVSLHVDQNARAFHLVRRNALGAERARQTIRFEEVTKISMVDGLPAADMRAGRMNWNMARIDIKWRKTNVARTITGDLAEIEPLLVRLRREVGMA